MGFGTTFARKMSQRSYQYAVRSTYDLLPKSKSSVAQRSNGTARRSDCATANPEKVKTEKSIDYGRDSKGVKYAGHTFAIVNGELHMIMRATAKMITLEDGSRRRMSGVEFKHAYEYENWAELERHAQEVWAEVQNSKVV